MKKPTITRKRREGLSAARLRAFMNYDPYTGLFSWRDTKTKRRKGMTASGKGPGGHIVIRVDSTNYYASRLAWLFMTSRWPKGPIEHKNGIASDNRWENLRQSSYSVTAHKSSPTRGSLGLRGVSYYAHRKAFRAFIKIEGRTRYLGTFDDAQKAHEAYRVAAASRHGKSARLV